MADTNHSAAGLATRTCIDAFLAAVESASVPELDGVFAPDALLDATVPNWRFQVRGGHAVRAQLAGWFADAGRFEELRRTPLPDGELVEFLLTWTEDGVPFAAHQAHRLRIEGGRIAGDTVWCGGRWSAELLAEMEAAAS
jgi:hypothetical protein